MAPSPIRLVFIEEEEFMTWTILKGWPKEHTARDRPYESQREVFVVVRSLSLVHLFETPQTAACQASLSFTISGACSNSCLLSQWCHPTISPTLLSPSPASIFRSIKVFSNESALRIRWPKYWTFSFSISLSNEYLGLISFDWFDLLAVQGGLSRVFSNTTVQKHQFFSVQPSLWFNSHIHTWYRKNHSFD